MYHLLVYISPIAFVWLNSDWYNGLGSVPRPQYVIARVLHIIILWCLEFPQKLTLRRQIVNSKGGRKKLQVVGRGRKTRKGSQYINGTLSSKLILWAAGGCGWGIVEYRLNWFRVISTKGWVWMMLTHQLSSCCWARRLLGAFTLLHSGLALPLSSWTAISEKRPQSQLQWRSLRIFVNGRGWTEVSGGELMASLAFSSFLQMRKLMLGG